MSKIDVELLAAEIVRGAKPMIKEEMIKVFERLAVLEKRVSDVEKSPRDRSR